MNATLKPASHSPDHKVADLALADQVAVFFPAALGLSSGGTQVQFIEISSSEILIGSAFKQ